MDGGRLGMGWLGEDKMRFAWLFVEDIMTYTLAMNSVLSARIKWHRITKTYLFVLPSKARQSKNVSY